MLEQERKGFVDWKSIFMRRATLDVLSTPHKGVCSSSPAPVVAAGVVRERFKEETRFCQLEMLQERQKINVILSYIIWLPE